MANKDFLFRAKADTRNYDANIAKARQQLDSFAKANLSTGGVIKQMSGSLVATAAKFASFGAAVAGAMKLAKDAFFNSEQSLDEWGRTVESSASLYKGFLNALNTGSISGYLNNISAITQAARDAYNAMDELATYNAFNRANMAEARSNYTEAVADFREGKGSKENVQSSSEALIKELQTRQEMEQNAYESAIKKLAAERGVSASDLRKVMTGTYGNYRELKNVEMTGTRVRTMATGNIGANTIVSYEEKFAANERERLAQALRNINDTELDALQALSETAKMTSVEINNQRKAAARILNGTNGSGGSGSGTGGRGGGKNTIPEVYPEGSLKQLQQEMRALQDQQELVTSATAWQQYQTKIDDVSKRIDALKGKVEEIELLPDLDVAVASVSPLEALKDKIRTELAESASIIDETTLATLLKTSIQNGLEGLDLDFSSIQEKMYEGLNITDEQWRELQNKINEKLKELGIEPINIDFKTGNVSSSDKSETSRETYGVDAISKVSSGINSMVASMDQLGVDIPSGLKEVLGGINAIVSILTTISAIMEAIEAIQSATSFMPFFAKGGIVPHAARGFVIPGNDHTDMTPILAQSGELILNKAAQGNIASLLNDSQKASGGTPYVSGEQIFLGLTNYLARTGRGEILTSRG